jgi:hypothetical protein
MGAASQLLMSGIDVIAIERVRVAFRNAFDLGFDETEECVLMAR